MLWGAFVVCELVWIGPHPLCSDRQCALFGSCVSRYQVYSANKTALNYGRSVKFFGLELVVPMPKLNSHREICGERREKQMGHGDNQDAHQMQVALRRRRRHRR